MAFVSRIVALSLLGLAIGCGEGSTPVEIPEVPVAEQIERDLQVIIDTGRVGSETVVISRNIEQLAETDPAKAEELAADLEELQGLSGPRARAKAEEMIEKL